MGAGPAGVGGPAGVLCGSAGAGCAGRGARGSRERGWRCWLCRGSARQGCVAALVVTSAICQQTVLFLILKESVEMNALFFKI